MKKFLWYTVGLIMVVITVIAITEPLMYSIMTYECFGFSNCDWYIENQCNTPDEYENSFFIGSYCEVGAICVSYYTVHCYDQDDGLPYQRNVVCEATSQWNCYNKY